MNFLSTMSVTVVDMNRDGIPDVLQQSQVGYSVTLQYGFYICALVLKTFAKMSKSPRTTTRGWLIVYTDFLLFPCFYVLSFALSDVCREHMWSWWRERNFSSPTRSSSSSELGPETGVCLELDAKLSAAMVTLAVARCQQVILGESATAVPLSACLGFKRSPLHRR